MEFTRIEYSKEGKIECGYYCGSCLFYRSIEGKLLDGSCQEIDYDEVVVQDNEVMLLKHHAFVYDKHFVCGPYQCYVNVDEGKVLKVLPKESKVNDADVLDIVLADTGVRWKTKAL
jgi:hypothetical protein